MSLRTLWLWLLKNGLLLKFYRTRRFDNLFKIVIIFVKQSIIKKIVVLVLSISQFLIQSELLLSSFRH